MSGVRDARSVYGRIMEALGSPARISHRLSDRELLVQRLLRDADCRLLILDEVQDIVLGSEREQLPAGTSRRHWKFSEYGLRQTPSLGWRRTYLLFAARTLAGSECFGHLLELDGATSPGWSLWWQQDLLPQLGPQQRETLSWLINQWGNWLNGNMQLKIATT